MSFKIVLLPPDVDASWPAKFSWLSWRGRQGLRGAKTPSRTWRTLTRPTGRCRPRSSPARRGYAGSAPPARAWAARGSMTRSCRATSWSRTCAAVTTSTSPRTRSPSCSPLPAASTSTCRLRAGSVVQTMFHLPDMTVLIVGVGGWGSAASAQCAAFGMRVLGCDPRMLAPAPGMAELFPPATLPDRIGEADFVLVTVPESPGHGRPVQRRAVCAHEAGCAYFINISRGGVVVTVVLLAALRTGAGSAGAGLRAQSPRSRCRPRARSGRCRTC